MGKYGVGELNGPHPLLQQLASSSELERVVIFKLGKASGPEDVYGLKKGEQLAAERRNRIGITPRKTDRSENTEFRVNSLGVIIVGGASRTPRLTVGTTYRMFPRDMDSRCLGFWLPVRGFGCISGQEMILNAHVAACLSGIIGSVQVAQRLLNDGIIVVSLPTSFCASSSKTLFLCPLVSQPLSEVCGLVWARKAAAEKCVFRAYANVLEVAAGIVIRRLRLTLTDCRVANGLQVRGPMIDATSSYPIPRTLYGIPCSAPIHWDAAGIVVTTETYMRLSRYADDQFSYSPMSLDHGVYWQCVEIVVAQPRSLVVDQVAVSLFAVPTKPHTSDVPTIDDKTFRTDCRARKALQ
ncbi:hypothetical protein CLF_100007 [Clonorchis sinensis]|uniref:Uncharacterized protein n=1 Tax=Clonorchis sinensis TaxID=79923 RepID=G7Y2G7_CLOSI|nr:hypothetical protein CLF_100007 [Clonorchis sinensis]